MLGGRVELVQIGLGAGLEGGDDALQLVSSRYERGSVIVTSNKPFTAWGEIFGHPVITAAIINRLVHHAEILSLKRDSYRLRDKKLSDDRPKSSPQAALA